VSWLFDINGGLINDLKLIDSVYPKLVVFHDLSKLVYCIRVMGAVFIHVGTRVVLGSDLKCVQSDVCLCNGSNTISFCVGITAVCCDNVVVTFITLPTPDVCFFSRVFLRGGNKKSVYKCLISESIFLVSALNLFRQNLYVISQLLYMLSIWLYVLEISIEIIQYRKDGLPGLYCDTLGSNTYSCIGGSEQLLYCHLLYKCVPNSTNAMVYMR